MRARLAATLVSIAASLTLVNCGGSKGFAPPVSSSALRPNVACPASKPGGVPLIIKNQSGLADSALTFYFTASNPSNSGQFVFMNAKGALTVFAPGNAAVAFPISQCFPGSLGKAGAKFTFPLLKGGRIWMAFGKLNIPGAANGQFTGPTGWVKGQSGYDVPWDFAEFSFNNPGIFVNLTRVDMLGLPMELQVLPVAKNKPGSFAQIGEKPGTYASILKSFVNAAPFNKNVVVIKGGIPRIINPSHTGAFPDIFKPYLKTVADYYKGRKITYDTAYKGGYCPGAWAASSDGSNFIFKQGGSTQKYPFSLFSSSAIFEDDPAKQGFNAGTCAYLLDKIVLQEFNRGVMRKPAHPVMTPKVFYPKGEIDNQYACILHNYSWHNAAYAFAFDDAANQASLIENTAPASVQITFGAIPKTLPKPTTKQECVAKY